MANSIQLLPDHVANQIAAGEVVQRPASVVKELLENAIDAGAKHIKLLIKDAGKTLVQVIDDGIGMNTIDARLSFERHATSKIKTAEDLFNLHTKGFRGEALASIAAIAHVELKTKTNDCDLGTKLIIEGSQVTTQDMAVVPTGTSIAVKNLFYNIPARRNFLKSNPVETRHVIDEFHRVALAHPQVAFEMYHNDTIVFNLPSSNLRQRITGVFGKKMDEKLVPVTEETDIVKVSGFVLKPEFAKKSRGEQFFFVNHRFIKSPYLHHGVVAAFEGIIKSENYPGYFLFLEVDPHSIDINIHPTKTEIKFEEEHAIYAMLRSTIKHSLGQFSVAPVLDFSENRQFETPYEYSKKTPSSPTIEIDKDFNPFQKESQKNIQFPYKREKSSSWESLYEGLGVNNIHKQDNYSSNITLESDESVEDLFQNQDAIALQFTFQLQNKYIVSPIKSGLLFIHQHLAHQRILYEDLLKSMTLHEAVSQQLLFPLKLSFSKPKTSLLTSLKEQLEFTGFSFTVFQEETLEITGIPSGIKESKVEEILEQLVLDFQNEVPDASFSQNDLLAKSLAKSMAIKTGIPLEQDAQEHIIHQLFACKEPSVAPDQRPVLHTMSVNDIDNKFK